MLVSVSNFTECFLIRTNCQYISIDSTNSLAPRRRQAISWFNVDLLYWRIFAWPSLYVLNIPSHYPLTYLSVVYAFYMRLSAFLRRGNKMDGSLAYVSQ